MSHELVHQWFGNLVTMVWWNDIWLNEGFASYIEYKGVANAHQDWQYEATFLIQDLHAIMDMDSLLSSRPIVQKAEDPNQITELFDGITYKKGSSVLRMLEDFIGQEKFKLGINRFLNKYKYKNAVTKDLWKALESVSDLPVERIMNTWTLQMGYPVLNVTRISETKFRIVQERFLKNPRSIGNKGFWEVPITWITNTNREKQLHWLSRTKMTEMKVEANTKWIKVNVGQFGYYRVNYEPSMWAELVHILLYHQDTLSPMDRASLINDAFALSEAGRLHYKIALHLLLYLKNERHYAPLVAAFNSLLSLRRRLLHTSFHKIYCEFVISLVKGHYDRLGWKDEGTHLEKLTRIKVLYVACKFDYRPCREEAKKRFKLWLDEKKSYIEPNFRSLVYYYGIQDYKDIDTWYKMWKKYLSEKNANEKVKISKGLAQVQNTEILKQFIKLVKIEDKVRSQDYFSIMSYISWNPIGQPLVWKFVQAEWTYLVKRFSIGSRSLGSLVKTVVNDFSTKAELKEVEAFFANNSEAGAGARARKQALEEIKINILWKADYLHGLQSWLHQGKHIWNITSYHH